MKKIPNRKASPKPPRGLNVRGLPPYVLKYLAQQAEAIGLSAEAYVRMKIITRVDTTLDRYSTQGEDLGFRDGTPPRS